MKILILLKQTPDLSSRFVVDSSGLRYNETDLPYKINDYDEFAIELAVSLKEDVKDECDVTLLSLGPERVVEALRKGLAMGADRAVHIVDDDGAFRDSFTIATAIAAYARDKEYDLIVAGAQSADRGSGQIPILVAAALDLPALPTLVSFELGGNGSIVADREQEGGVLARVAINTPAVVTCQMGLNKPRYPTLPNIMKAKKKELVTIALGDLVDLTTSPLVETGALFVPEKKGSGEVLEGSVAEQADKIVAALAGATGG